MNSIDSLAKPGRFTGLGTASILSLIVVGYLALTGSAFWAFSKGSFPFADSSGPASASAGTLVCQCHLQPQDSCGAD